MDTGYPIVYRMTAAEYASGAGVSLSGGFIEIVGTDGVPTGAVYITGISGTPPVPIGGNAFRNAAENIAAFDIVYDVDGATCRKASSSDPSHAEQILGMALNTATTGQSVEIIRSGHVSTLTGMSSGMLFLGTSGSITHGPATTGVHVQVGYAFSSTEADINIGTPIYL